MTIRLANFHQMILCGQGRAFVVMQKGQGELKVFEDGQLHTTYLGALKAGDCHGQGTMMWDNGDKYEDQWQDGRYHGEGTFTHANGRIEKGRWENGRKIDEFPF